MKLNKIIGLLVWMIAGFIFQSCSDITDMQREYLDRGETLYVGRLDSIKFRGGLHRVQMEGLLNYARSASRCVVSWDDQSQEYAIDAISNGDTAKVLIEDLEEGTYRFFIQTFDEEGNKSVKSECYGYVYGDEYIMSQSPKFIIEMVPDPDKMVLKWNVSDNAVKVQLSYENLSGEMVRQILPGDVKDTEITDWKEGGKKVERLNVSLIRYRKKMHWIRFLLPLMCSISQQMLIMKSIKLYSKRLFYLRIF